MEQGVQLYDKYRHKMTSGLGFNLRRALGIALRMRHGLPVGK
jgi:hypothetical protein